MSRREITVQPANLQRSVLHQAVEVVLGPVLRGRHFEDVSNAEQCFLSVSVLDDLQDGEVLQDRVHHVFLWQTLQFEDEVDHVFTHWTAADLIQVATTFKSWVFRLNLLHNLLPKAADFGGALDGHTLVTLVAVIKYFKCNESDIAMVLIVMKLCKVSRKMFYGW